MRLSERLAAHRRPETGATLVEFALVAPLVFLVIFALISGCFLEYQNSAMHDGASAGARMASIETSLAQSQGGAGNGQYCESGQPLSIQKAVAQASPLLAVNQNPLCATSPSGPLTQTPINGDVNITVTCGTSCAAPTTTEVSLALTTKGLVAPIGLTYSMSATSEVPGPTVSP